jgi:hypothetical protein
MDAHQERTLRSVERLAGVESWEVPDWLVRLVDQAELPEAVPRAVWKPSANGAAVRRMTFVDEAPEEKLISTITILNVAIYRSS